ncbi:MAG: hypothetical protein Q4G58_08150 [bacterium]|nr:hypothetical protein [bacterium]
MEEEIKKEYCINLCELLKHIEVSGISLEQIIHSAEKTLNTNSISRIYIGSYFCSQYFMHLTEADCKDVLEYVNQHNGKVTLVIPIVTEKNLKKVKLRIDSFINYFGAVMDEITVNDYGMLEYIYNKYKLKLNLGRLFMKDYRDPRYPEYFKGPFRPRVFTSYIRSIVEKYEIHAMEFDPTHKELDFAEKPEGVLIGLHTPYCYMTTGQICEYSSVDKDIKDKFRPNPDCDVECLSHHIEYDLEEIEEERKFIRFGRTVYFENKDCKVLGLTDMRVIYLPLDTEIF